MKKKPLVSILIASYNKEKFVNRCIESCLRQSYKNIEIIFVDDNSSDSSYSKAKKFKKIKIFKKSNKTEKRKFNTYFQIETYLYAYKKSKGDFISFLDSDDFFKKKKIEKIIDFFSKNKDDQIVLDKPIIFYSKNNFFLHNDYFNDKRKKKWPKFPPQSCISIRRNFLKIIINEIKKKKFPLLTFDFRLAVLSHLVYNNFSIIDEHLTYYFQDRQGESLGKFQKFSANWWLRRYQAFEYLDYLSKKYKIKKNISFDLILTFIVAYNINLFSKFFRDKS